MFCIYHYFPVKKKQKKTRYVYGRSKIVIVWVLLCTCLCVWMLFWPLTQIIKVVALRILYMFWTRDRRERSSLSFHFLWRSSTFSRLHQLLLPSDGFGMCTVTFITPHRNTSTVTSFWHDISNNMPYIVMHGSRRHVCSGAACFYHPSPLFISIEKLLFILG